MSGQRKLDQDSVDIFILVETVNQRQQLPLGYPRGKQMFVRFYPYFFACFFLVLHIDVRPRIISDQHHSQSGDQPPTPLKPVHLFFDLFLHFFSDSFTVYDRCHDLLRKTYTEKKKFVKMGRFYWHDMEPSKAQPPKVC